MNKPGASLYQSPPRLRNDIVERQECLRVIDLDTPRSLVALLGPAGAGKSTVLLQILASVEERQETACWVSFEQNSARKNNLLNALSVVFKDQGVPLKIEEPAKYDRGLVGQMETEIISYVHSMVQALEAFGNQIHLFLDDLHNLSERDMLSVFPHLIDMQPDNLHVYFASRSKPNIPTEVLKAQNRYTELTWHHLHFTEDETHKFFSKMPNTEISPQNVKKIYDATDGWPAGIALAHLRSRLGTYQKVNLEVSQEFQEDVSAYFRTEIFNNFPDYVQDFLIKISVLTKINDNLAATLAGISTQDVSSIFEYLVKNGFPVIDLDTTGRWKRFHHLFQDLLGDILAEQDEVEKNRLNLLASDWFAEQGDSLEAIEYAVLAQDFTKASDLVDAYAIDIFNRGQSYALTHWIEAVPEKIIVRRPELRMYLCLVYAHSRETTEAISLYYEKALQAVEALNAIGHFADQNVYDRLRHELEAILVIILFRMGSMGETIRQAEKVLEHKHLLRDVFIGSVCNTQGNAYMVIGDPINGRKAMSLGREHHLQADCTIGIVFSECFRGLLEFNQGNTTAALSLYNAAYQYSARKIGEKSLLACTAILYKSVVDYEQNTFEIKRDHLKEALETCFHHSEPGAYTDAMLTMFRRLVLNGATSQANELLTEATDYAQRIGNPSIHMWICYVRFNYQISCGDLNSAMAIFNEIQPIYLAQKDKVEAKWSRMDFWYDLFRAGVLQATAHPQKALPIYTDLVKDCRAASRVRRLIYVLARQALAQASCGDTSGATTALEEALDLTRQCGLVRILLDIGHPFISLMRNLDTNLVEVETQIFAKTLIALSEDDQSESEIQAKNPGVILQSLTQKEMEILRLITAGAKNKDIGEAMEISQNTVKWHLKNVYEKLSVKNRTEAALLGKTFFAAL